MTQQTEAFAWIILVSIIIPMTWVSLWAFSAWVKVKLGIRDY